MIACVFVANVKFQLNQIEGFKEYLMFIDQANKDISRQEIEVSRALHAKSVAASSQASSSSSAQSGSGFSNIFSTSKNVESLVIFKWHIYTINICFL